MDFRWKYSVRVLLLAIALLCIPLAWYVQQRNLFLSELGAATILEERYDIVVLGEEDARLTVSAVSDEFGRPRWEWSEVLSGRLYVPIRSFAAENAVINDEIAACMASLTYLDDVQLVCPTMDIDNGSLFDGMDRVEELYVERGLLSSADFRAISKLKRLRRLELPHCNVTDESLAWIGDCEHLTELSISGAAVSTDGLECLRGLGLRSLNLAEASIEPGELGNVGTLTSLEVLNLRQTSANDDVVNRLARLPTLRWLSLKETDVTDSSVPTLVSMLRKSLEEVIVGESRISLAGQKVLLEATKERKNQAR